MFYGRSAQGLRTKATASAPILRRRGAAACDPGFARNPGNAGTDQLLCVSGADRDRAGRALELLPILLAIDVIPDMFRTVANVTHDVAAAAAITPPTAIDQ